MLEFRKGPQDVKICQEGELGRDVESIQRDSSVDVQQDEERLQRGL